MNPGAVYWLPPLLAGLASLGMAAYIYDRRRSPRVMILMLLVLAEWSLTYLMETVSIGFQAKMFWSKLEWAGVLATPLLWLLFALRFSGRYRLPSRRNIALLAVVPVVALILAWTNESHGLIWKEFYIDAGGVMPMLVAKRALGYWILFVLYSYGLVLGGILLLVRGFLSAGRYYLRQMTVMLVGVTFPLAGNIMFNLGLNPFPHLDFTSSAFTVSVFCLAWGMFRLRLLDVVPVAREAVVEGMADAVFVLDVQNRVIDMNPAARKLTGAAGSEILGADFTSLLADVSFPAETLIGEEETQSEISLQGRHYDLRTSPLPHPQGGVIGRLIAMRDVTNRKLVEDALRESEERNRAVLEASVDPIVVYDMGGRVVFANPSFTRVFGWTLAEIEGRRLEFVPPEERLLTLSLIEQTMRGERIQGVETRRLTKAGNTIPVNINASHYHDPHGRPVGSVVSLRDASARKNMENDLRDARNYLQDVFDSMPSALVGVDGEGRVTQWNEQARGLSTRDTAAAIGAPLAEVFPFLAGHIDHVRECLILRRPLVLEKTQIPIGEDIRYLDLIIYPLASSRSGAGAVIRMDDVTARLRMEEIIVQTEKMSSVGALAAGMAHEINNPLGGIIQGAGNIRRRLDPGFEPNNVLAQECGSDIRCIWEYLERRKINLLLDGVESAGRRAARIVTNMLEFSRHSDTERLPARLDELLDKTVELAANDYDLKKQFDFYHIDLVREYDPLLPPVPCEPTKIEQVFLNLLKNAAQALAESGTELERRPRIVLRTGRDGDFAKIEVQDNGPGMNESIRKRIFEPFFTTKKVGVGTGLGLSVSYFIISKDHGGSLSVDSEPGQGARFTILLPLSHLADI